VFLTWTFEVQTLLLPLITSIPEPVNIRATPYTMIVLPVVQAHWHCCSLSRMLHTSEALRNSSSPDRVVGPVNGGVQQ